MAFHPELLEFHVVAQASKLRLFRQAQKRGVAGEARLQKGVVKNVSGDIRRIIVIRGSRRERGDGLAQAALVQGIRKGVHDTQRLAVIFSAADLDGEVAENINQSRE